MTHGAYTPTGAVPIVDTAPSEVEIEVTLLPCGCDAGVGQECARCHPRPEPVHIPPPSMNREQAANLNGLEIPNRDTNILLEAYEITGGDRQNDYGTPERNWNRIAAIASAMTDGKPVLLTAEVCVKVLIATKLARMVTSPKKRDNYVDLAGYAHVLFEVVK